jgi:hypothetical protein
MRWQDMRGSDNVEDREDASPARGGLGGGLKLGGVGLVVVVAISMFLGLNPLDVLNSLGGGANGPTAPTERSAPAPHPGPAVRDENKEFVARILGDTEDTWGKSSTRGVSSIARPPWSSSEMRSTRPAARPAPQRGRSTAQVTIMCTSTCRSFRTCGSALAPPATLPGPT